MQCKHSKFVGNVEFFCVRDDGHDRRHEYEGYGRHKYGYECGRADERRAVVEWLQAQAAQFADVHSWVGEWLHGAAKEIEAGEHVQVKEKEE